MEHFYADEFSQLTIGQQDTSDSVYHRYSESHDDVTRGLRVAIIGAGASGIAALRTFALSPIKHDITIFERSNRVGGLWNYDGEGPMYRNLKTNFAKQGMAFPDFPFAEDVFESYVTHRDVKDYLQEYFDSVDGNKFIKFNTTVCNVVPLTNETYDWRITYKTMKRDICVEETADFDAVFVCNGHFDFPHIPNIPGLENFPGQTLHSRDYKVPEAFTGKTVVVLGGANSGQDIAADLASEAAQVIISHNNSPLPSRLFPNMSQCSGIVSCDEKGFTLMDGSILPHPDVLICATGFLFNFSFLDCSCGIESDGFGNIQPLYKHFVNANHPSMFLIGVGGNVAPFPMFYMQSQAALAILEKRYSLPDKATMLDEIDEDFNTKVMKFKKAKHAHMLTDDQWSYNDEMAKIAGCNPLKPYVKEVFYKCAYMRRNHLTYYREYKFVVEDIEKVEMIPLNGAPAIDESDLVSAFPEHLRNKTEERDCLDLSTESDTASGRDSSVDSSSSANQSSDEGSSSESEFSEFDNTQSCKRKRLPTNEQEFVSSVIVRG